MAKKSIKEEIREILAEDFVGPPLPERRMAGPFAADYVNAPPGYEPAPTEPLGLYDLEYGGKGIAPYLDEYGYMLEGPSKSREDYRKRSIARINARREAHPASGYYGKYAHPGNTPAMGSEGFFPGWGEQVPERGEFYPPPTISKEEQEMINAERGALADAIERALKESKKKDK